MPISIGMTDTNNTSALAHVIPAKAGIYASFGALSPHALQQSEKDIGACGRLRAAESQGASKMNRALVDGQSCFLHRFR